MTYATTLPLCLFCKKNKTQRWNRPCPTCRESRKAGRKSPTLIITRREPSAVIQTEDGATVTVDKFGKEI